MSGRRLMMESRGDGHDADMSSTLNITQVSTYDIAGGAERIAMNLHTAYRDRGHCVAMAVGWKRSQDPDVFELDHDAMRSAWARAWLRLENAARVRVGRIKGAGRVQLSARAIGQPLRDARRRQGEEDMSFPATARLIDLAAAKLGRPPDIIHCHNLHGGYFDLRQLPAISARQPTILTLHDAWMLSGHCAHSLGCPRWTSGCGHCPDLSIHPAVPRDATAFNWRRKKDIYSQCRLFVATPSQWLMDKVKRSMLMPGIVEARVIPNGVDPSVFRPGDKDEARRRLGIAPAARVALFAAAGIRANAFKDYATLREAIGRVGERLGENLILLALGEDSPSEKIGRATIRFVPFCTDPSEVAGYCHAADVYVHAARADTFPNTILEAMGCGVPVAASAVGGIVEQVVPGMTGSLVPPGDPEALANAIVEMLTHEKQRRAMGDAACERVRRLYTLAGQVDAYLSWYDEIRSFQPG